MMSLVVEEVEQVEILAPPIIMEGSSKRHRRSRSLDRRHHVKATASMSSGSTTTDTTLSDHGVSVLPPSSRPLNNGGTASCWFPFREKYLARKERLEGRRPLPPHIAVANQGITSFTSSNNGVAREQNGTRDIPSFEAGVTENLLEEDHEDDGFTVSTNGRSNSIASYSTRESGESMSIASSAMHRHSKALAQVDSNCMSADFWQDELPILECNEEDDEEERTVQRSLTNNLQGWTTMAHAAAALVAQQSVHPKELLGGVACAPMEEKKTDSDEALSSMYVIETEDEDSGVVAEQSMSRESSELMSQTLSLACNALPMLHDGSSDNEAVKQHRIPTDEEMLENEQGEPMFSIEVEHTPSPDRKRDRGRSVWKDNFITRRLSRSRSRGRRKGSPPSKTRPPVVSPATPTRTEEGSQVMTVGPLVGASRVQKGTRDNAPKSLSYFAAAPDTLPQYDENAPPDDEFIPDLVRKRSLLDAKEEELGDDDEYSSGGENMKRSPSRRERGLSRNREKQSTSKRSKSRNAKRDTDRTVSSPSMSRGGSFDQMQDSPKMARTPSKLELREDKPYALDRPLSPSTSKTESLVRTLSRLSVKRRQRNSSRSSSMEDTAQRTRNPPSLLVNEPESHVSQSPPRIERQLSSSVSVVDPHATLGDKWDQTFANQWGKFDGDHATSHAERLSHGVPVSTNPFHDEQGVGDPMISSNFSAGTDFDDIFADVEDDDSGNAWKEPFVENRAPNYFRKAKPEALGDLRRNRSVVDALQRAHDMARLIVS